MFYGADEGGIICSHESVSDVLENQDVVAIFMYKDDAEHWIRKVNDIYPVGY